MLPEFRPLAQGAESRDGPVLTLAHWVLQSSVSQLTTKTPERGLLDASHKHVSHRLEETTAPG